MKDMQERKMEMREAKIICDDYLLIDTL